MAPFDPGTDESPPTLRRRLGEMLVEMGALDPARLSAALRQQGDVCARLGEVLWADGAVHEDVVAAAVAAQQGLDYVADLPPPDRDAGRLAALIAPTDAVRLRALPVARELDGIVVATASPEEAEAIGAALPLGVRLSRLLVAPRAAVEARIDAVHGRALATLAATRAPRALSARGWPARPAAVVIVALMLGLFVSSLWFPARTWQVLTLAGLAMVALNLVIRSMGLIAVVGMRTPDDPAPDRLPVISMMIPLADEAAIVPALLARLQRLDYPRAALDVMLVVEDGDAATLATLRALDLPSWVRVVTVPPGGPATKPRALNHALGFARGEIVGVWDAEDAPAPDQLRRVAARFAAAPPDVACLQGRLAFYNADRNWLARCFAIDYAVWFGFVLPGLARLGFVVPLGGTTLFFRRAALDAVGAWDAHNVTEDADLGIRLARKGWRTEVIATTTSEEANAAVLPWIRQRSRWIKGYAMTWAVHTSRPVALLRDLGLFRVAGLQAVLLTAILGPLLLPFAWSTLILAFGLPHPVVDGLPPVAAPVLTVAMAALVALDVGLAAAACRRTDQGHLLPWIPTMQIYFAMATLAAGRAVWELVHAPYHWHKTAHGTFGGREED